MVMDYDSYGGLPEKQVENVLLGYADAVYFTDVRNAVDSYDRISGKTEQMDLVINCEEKTGSETLSILMCKNNGTVYFTSMSNRYAASVLIAESMRKEIVTLDMNQYF